MQSYHCIVRRRPKCGAPIGKVSNVVWFMGYNLDEWNDCSDAFGKPVLVEESNQTSQSAKRSDRLWSNSTIDLRAVKTV